VRFFTSPHHLVAAALAVVVALLLIAGMLLGGMRSLPDVFTVHKSIRDIAVALWAFLLPAWFMLEEVWFGPPASEPERLARFRAGQRKAQQTWVIVGGAVAIIIGLSASPLSGSAVSPVKGDGTSQKS
jgi:hypothetical protein